MKTTGIIRRIDDLGRIVIPKEIRKTLRIKNGENLEIFVNENENIILKKYSQINKLKDLSEEIAETINRIIKKTIIITNTEKIVTVKVNNKNKYENQNISEEIIKKIYNRKEIHQKEFLKIKITTEEEEISYALVPIIASGDIIGSVIVLSEDKTLEKQDFIITKIVADFLSKYIEG